jgi:phosphate transport system substrate-binding protein
MSARSIRQALIALLLTAMPLAHAQIILGRGYAPANELLLAWNQSQTGVSVRYEPLGPGDGIEAATMRLADFGVADYTLDAKTLRDNKIIQVPILMSAVAVVVNLKVLAEPVKLDGAALAGIFSGRITLWNDPALVALNPGLAKVVKSIAPVIRTDPAGITRTFTEFLTVVDPDWRVSTGVVYQFKARTAIGKQGAAGVLDAVRTFDGAIGFVDYYAGTKAGLKFAAVRNHQNEFIVPNRQTIAASIQAIPWAKAVNGSTSSFDVQLTNMTAFGVYPIMSAIFAFIPRGMDRKRETAVRSYFIAGMKDGGNVEKLGYVAFPPSAMNVLAGDILR